MELRNLITLTHVADLGSFTKAAEKLGYSQSTISFQIKQLEEELGCLLFERINHTITLTVRGRELVAYAQQVRALTEEIQENLTQAEVAGEIHIVTPDSVCEEMINAHYLEFRSQYPKISVKFTTADTSVMFEMLDRNAADVIMTLDAHSYHKEYTIAKEERIGMHFVARKGSKFEGKPVSVEDLAREQFVLTEHGQGYRRVFDKELSRKSINITPVLEIGRTDIITSLVSQSEMISYLPDFVTKDAVEKGKLVYLDVTDFEIEIWKQLIYHKDKWLSKSLRTLIEFIKEREFTA